MRYCTKYLFYFCLTLLLVTACEDDPELIIVPGTRVMMYPPVGFSLDSAKTRFIRADSAFLFIHENSYKYPEGKNLANERLVRSGAKLLDTLPVSIGGFSGQLSRLRLNGSYKAICVVFGDSGFCQSLLGVYPKNNDDANHELMKSIMNAKYVKEIKLKERLRDFVVDENKSIFKKQKEEKDAVYYTVDGKESKEGSGSPFIIANHRSFEEYYQDADEVIRIATTMLIEKGGYTTVTAKNKRYFTLNGYGAFELELHCKSGEREMLFYILNLSCPGTVLRFDCVCYYDFEYHLDEFKRLVYSTTFKD